MYLKYIICISTVHLYLQLCLIISSLTCSALSCLMNMWTFRPPARWAQGLLWWSRSAISNVVSCLVKGVSLFLYCLSEIKFIITFLWGYISLLLHEGIVQKLWNVRNNWMIVLHAQQEKGLILHYDDDIMGAMASQITSLTIVYPTVLPGGDQRKHQSSASLVFVRGIHQWPVNSPHKEPETREMLPFDCATMFQNFLVSYMPSLIFSNIY